MQAVSSLLEGTAADPVAACREYERLEIEAAATRGDASGFVGSTCEGSRETVRYTYHDTARLTAESFGDWDFTRSLARTRVALLVVAGDRDAALVPLMRRWSTVIPNGRTLIVPGVGAGLRVDRPDVFFPAVETFVRGGWPEGATPPAR